MAAAADATLDDNKNNEPEEEEETGGLDDEEETLTLKSGGQQPKTFEINKTDAELSKFVTTILEGTCILTHLHAIQVYKSFATPFHSTLYPFSADLSLLT